SIPQPPRSTPSPYTTLFRSPWRAHTHPRRLLDSQRGCCSSRLRLTTSRGWSTTRASRRDASLWPNGSGHSCSRLYYETLRDGVASIFYFVSMFVMLENAPSLAVVLRMSGLLMAMCLSTTPALADSRHDVPRGNESDAPARAPWQPRWGYIGAGLAAGAVLYAFPCAKLQRADMCVPGGPFYEAGRRLVTGDAVYGLFDVYAYSVYGFLQ